MGLGSILSRASSRSSTAQSTTSRRSRFNPFKGFNSSVASTAPAPATNTKTAPPETSSPYIPKAPRPAYLGVLSRDAPTKCEPRDPIYSTPNWNYRKVEDDNYTLPTTATKLTKLDLRPGEESNTYKEPMIRSWIPPGSTNAEEIRSFKSRYLQGHPDTLQTYQSHINQIVPPIKHVSMTQSQFTGSIPLWQHGTGIDLSVYDEPEEPPKPKMIIAVEVVQARRKEEEEEKRKEIEKTENQRFNDKWRQLNKPPEEEYIKFPFSATTATATNGTMVDVVKELDEASQALRNQVGYDKYADTIERARYRSFNLTDGTGFKQVKEEEVPALKSVWEEIYNKSLKQQMEPDAVKNVLSCSSHLYNATNTLHHMSEWRHGGLYWDGSAPYMNHTFAPDTDTGTAANDTAQTGGSWWSGWFGGRGWGWGGGSAGPESGPGTGPTPSGPLPPRPSPPFTRPPPTGPAFTSPSNGSASAGTGSTRPGVFGPDLFGAGSTRDFTQPWIPWINGTHNTQFPPRPPPSGTSPSVPPSVPPQTGPTTTGAQTDNPPLRSYSNTNTTSGPAAFGGPPSGLSFGPGLHNHKSRGLPPFTLPTDTNTNNNTITNAFQPPGASSAPRQPPLSAPSASRDGNAPSARAPRYLERDGKFFVYNPPTTLSNPPFTRNKTTFTPTGTLSTATPATVSELASAVAAAMGAVAPTREPRPETTIDADRSTLPNPTRETLIQHSTEYTPVPPSTTAAVPVSSMRGSTATVDSADTRNDTASRSHTCDTGMPYSHPSTASTRTTSAGLSNRMKARARELLCSQNKTIQQVLQERLSQGVNPMMHHANYTVEDLELQVAWANEKARSEELTKSKDLLSRATGGAISASNGDNDDDTEEADEPIRFFGANRASAAGITEYTENDPTITLRGTDRTTSVGFNDGGVEFIPDSKDTRSSGPSYPSSRTAQPRKSALKPRRGLTAASIY